MYRISPFRSTLNTNVITGLDMCEVCTEAVHSLSETVFTISTTLTRFYGTTGIFRLHFRGALFADSATLPRFCVWHPADSTNFDNPYKGAVSAGCQKLPINRCRISAINSIPLISSSFNLFSDHQCHLNRMTTSSVLECLVKF